jgi:RNA polymerase sigma-70 factor (ECF subfamily)
MNFSLDRSTDAGSSTERELLERIGRRDADSEDALAQLYDRYARLLYSVILAIVKHPPEAQDLLQEVFVQVWNNASSFDATRGSVYAWIVTLTRNRAIDRIRSKAFRERQQEEFGLDAAMYVAATTASPLDATLMNERSELVRIALEQLSPEQRQALMLAYFQGYTQSEIAEELDIPLGTVKTRVRQGLQKLHDLLTND